MRILLCAKNDLAALYACNHLADALAGHDVTLWLSDITRSVERERADLDLMRFFERELPLRYLLPALAPNERGPFLDFKHLAARLGAGAHVVPRLSHMRDAFHALAPDLVVSIRFSHIFPADLVGVPRFGILNVHPGTLPDYGGLYTPFHQIAAGADAIGCTVHVIDAGIDTGPIVATRRLDVDPNRSLLWHVVHTYPLAVPVIARAIAVLENGGTLGAQPQDLRHRRYHRLPSDAAMTHFQRSMRLVSPRDFTEVMARFGVGAQAQDLARAACPEAAQ